MLDLADAPGFPHAGDRPLRARPSRTARARAAAADGRRPSQGPELRPGRALALLACATAVSARRAAQARGARASPQRAGLPVARRPRLAGPVLSGGHAPRRLPRSPGGLRARPGPIVDREGRVLGEHLGAHTVTVGQRHGLGAGRGLDTPRAAVSCSATDPAEHRHRRFSRTAAHSGRPRTRCDAPSRRCARRRVKVRYRGALLPCRLRRPTRGRRAPGARGRAERAGRAHRSRADRVPVCG